MRARQWVKSVIRRYYQIHPGFRQLRDGANHTKLLSAQSILRENNARGIVESLDEVELRVFSQFGDDGIIQYLIHRIRDIPKRFIECGVGTYTECNTRFLLENDNWEGLIFDGDQFGIEYVRREPLFWLHRLTAVSSLLNNENINRLIREHGFAREIGLFSLDIDGVDYWLWKSLSVVDPVIVVVEYNALFGDTRAVTVPYDPMFDRYRAHFSGVYWGASLKAFCILGDSKGYTFVGCNSAGNNAYFVRKDCLKDIKVPTLQKGFREATWSDSRDKHRRLDHLSVALQRERIKDLYVVDIETGRQLKVGEI